MINRLMPVSVAVLLVFMPSIGGLQTPTEPFSWQQASAEIDRDGKDEVSVTPLVLRKPPTTTEVTAPAETATSTIDKEQTNSAQLWQTLETLLSQSEFQQIPIMAALLADSLRKKPDPDIYLSIRDLLMQPDLALEVKAILLDFLSETATPEALDILLELARQELQSSLYILVLQSISRIGDNRWNGQFHEELSPALQAAWADPDAKEPELLAALGKAIAAVGAPQGVDQLLMTVSDSTQNTEPEATHRIKQEVAFRAVPQVRNPAAVKVLGTSLKQEPVGTPAFEASGNALAAINSAAATQQIADWAKDAPAEGARNLKGWLSKIDDEKALAPIASTQRQSVQSPEIETIIDNAASTPSNRPFSLTSALKKK